MTDIDSVISREDSTVFKCTVLKSTVSKCTVQFPRRLRSECTYHKRVSVFQHDIINLSEATKEPLNVPLLSSV